MKYPIELNDIHKFVLSALRGCKSVLLKPVSEAMVRVIALNAIAANHQCYFHTETVAHVREIVKMDDSNEVPARQETKKELEFMERVGLLNIQQFKEELRGHELVELTDKGNEIANAFALNRMPIIRPSEDARNTIFIAMALGREDVDALFKETFSPVCYELGYEPIRIDQKEPVRTITNEILDMINDSMAVIADLTYARQSVYFEAGYAHGLGVPLLLTCRRDHWRGVEDATKIHFDLEQYKISFWEPDDNGIISWEDGQSPRDRLPKLVPSRFNSSS